MIIEKLCQFYDENKENLNLPIPGLEDKQIRFIIVINSNGEFINIEDTSQKINNKDTIKKYRVIEDVNATSGVNSNFLYGNIEYVLGEFCPDKTRDKKNRAAAKKESFITKIKNNLDECEDKNVLLKFYENFDNNFNKIKKQAEDTEIWSDMHGSQVSFKILNKNIPACEDLINNYVKLESKIKTEQCCISGKKSKTKETHPKIYGVKETKGSTIISFNEEDTSFYKKTQGHRAPIDENIACKYGLALNYLLQNNKRDINNTTFIFWGSNNSSNWFDVSNVNDVQDLFKSIYVGKQTNINTKFYLLGLHGNQGRSYISFWYNGDILDFKNKFEQHFEDLKIYGCDSFPLNKILEEIFNKKNIPPNLPEKIYEAILQDKPYPKELLTTILYKHNIKNESFFAGIIKAFIIRYERNFPTNNKELKMSLDENNINIGYLLGRLLAVYDKISEEADCKPTEKFFTNGCKNLIKTFTSLEEQKQYRIKKIQNKGRIINFEKMISGIMQNINEIPKELSLLDQGRAYVGYFHQRNEFFVSKTNNEESEKQ